MKKLFHIFEHFSDGYERFVQLEQLIKDEVADAEGKMAAKHYQCLVTLMNSINNAGCEERRQGQIRLLRGAMDQISDKYEKYLP